MRLHRGSIVCFLLALAGMSLCLYIGFLHLALMRGELLGGAACGSMGSVFNCHAVTSGYYSSFLFLPFWVWGIIGYLAVMNLASIGWLFPDWRAHALSLIVLLGLISVSVDGILLTIMLTKIRYLCTFCLLTYAVNTLILGVSAWSLAKPPSQYINHFAQALGAFVPSMKRPQAWMFLLTMAMTSTGSIALYAATQYVVQGAPGAMQSQLSTFVMKEQREHVDTSGDPAEGPAEARVTLVEFSDFFCPACQKASQFNKIYLSGHRDNVKLVFKNYPLDPTCNDAVNRMVHPGACTVAAAAECVHEQGKFWPLHDLFFKYGHEYDMSRLQSDVKQLGVDENAYNECVSSGRGLIAVRKDIEEGKRLGVGSTPTFVVNGLKMPGVISPVVFDMLYSTLTSSGEPLPAASPSSHEQH